MGARVRFVIFLLPKRFRSRLLQPPQLTNCVLLRELKLDDNSISSLDSLSSAWLPLLRCLSLSQNRCVCAYIRILGHFLLYIYRKS